ncbi:MAG TPA: hypothetical protein VL155_04720 [Terriglobales bacterium]|jgi:hypothetical protein|nr:hypothetical protein [Terriglobales bacterium]
MAAKCAFCSEDAVEHGGEHIWDDWLNRALPVKKFRVRQQRSPVEPFREYPARVLKEKLPVVCENCNNTWMSDVTNQVKQSFAELIISGASVCLLPTGVGLLAAFAFMKSVVADHAANRDEPFYTRAVRERFRQTRIIPPNVQMWVGAYQGVQRYSGKCISFYPTPDQPGPLYGVEFFGFTYVVGQLVLQTHAARWIDVRLRGLPLPPLRPDQYWNAAVSRFWPSDGVPIAWPPEKYIGDDTIQKFMERFNVPIHIRDGS